MTIVSRAWSSTLVLAAASLAACSGSSSGDGAPTVSLAVTDAASDDISTFVIGLEAVELQRATGAPVSLLQLPIAVDFAALSNLSRVLNVAAVPADTYTGVEIQVLFDNDRVFLNGSTTPANLLDMAGTPLAGTLTIQADFPAPLVADAGNTELELDLDLNQSVDVDVGANEVYLEPTLLPRIDPAVPKEHAIGGDLRTVVLGQNLFRIGLEALPGDPTPVVTVGIGAGTVFQINGVCLVGLAGLAALDNLTAGSWVQAFGQMDASTSYFDATTVEAGTGSYNGGTDIVEGLVTGRTGSDLTVRGHSNDAAHAQFTFNLDFLATSTPADTKVVRRGSSNLYDIDDVNVGQRVRMFGLLTLGPPLPHKLDISTPTDVVRCEPTTVRGTVVSIPTPNKLEIDLVSVDFRDAAAFTWAEGGPTPADPDHFFMQVGNLAVGKGIGIGTPVVATGFFSAPADAGDDFTASTLVNSAQMPSLLLIRDRAAGLTVTPTIAAGQIDFAFGGAAAGREKAVIDQGWVGETDVTGPGITVVPSDGLFGLGIHVLRDRTLNTLEVYLTFGGFSQALDAALVGGATLFNFGALGDYDSGNDRIATALAGAVVQ